MRFSVLKQHACRNLCHTVSTFSFLFVVAVVFVVAGSHNPQNELLFPHLIFDFDGSTQLCLIRLFPSLLRFLFVPIPNDHYEAEPIIVSSPSRKYSSLHTIGQFE